METVIALLFGTVSTAESSYISEQKHGHTLMSVATMLSNRRSVQRRFAEAQKLAQTDINLHPKDTGAQMAKAVALNGLGQYHAAIACAQPIFLRYPYQAGVASTLAMAYCRAGHFQEALTPMLYEIARADSGSEQQEAIALAELVMPHLSSKDIADGLARVSTQIDQTNHHASFHHNLSQVFERLGDPKRAEQELRIAVDASMSNSQWMMQLGNLNESERKYKEALQSYMAAQTMSPESEAIALRLHRFETRLVNQGNDLAWRLRDAIRGH